MKTDKEKEIERLEKEIVKLKIQLEDRDLFIDKLLDFPNRRKGDEDVTEAIRSYENCLARSILNFYLESNNKDLIYLVASIPPLSNH